MERPHSEWLCLAAAKLAAGGSLWCASTKDAWSLPMNHDLGLFPHHDRSICLSVQETCNRAVPRAVIGWTGLVVGKRRYRPPSFVIAGAVLGAEITLASGRRAGQPRTLQGAFGRRQAPRIGG